jgi:hypothetical protein
MVRELGVTDTRAALREIRSRVESYLRDMEIPANVITVTMETDPGTVVIAEMNPSGTWDYGFLPSIIDSLTDGCRIPSVRERQQLPRVMNEMNWLQDRGQPVPPALRQSFANLTARYHDAERCMWREISRDAVNARDIWQLQRSSARFQAAMAENERIRQQAQQARQTQTLSNPVRVEIEGVGIVEIDGAFLTVSREEQGRIVDSIVAQLQGRQGEPTIPWRPMR